MPVIALVLAALASPAAASAAVFQVTNTSDPGSGACNPGNCSLRDAIAGANGGSGSDMVLVPPGVYVLGAAGALSVTNGMQIVGTAGAVSTIIDAHNASGIVSIASSAGSVSVSGLTLTHGMGSSGSAIADLGAGLTLSGDAFTLNTTGGEGAAGAGAVLVNGKGSKTLTVTNSTFYANAAGGEGTKSTSSGQGGGGGIEFEAAGTLTVAESTFTGNTAGGNGGEGTSSAQGTGGAIEAVFAGVVAVTNSSFTANRAGGNGGAGVSSAQGLGGAIGFLGETATDALTVAGSTFTGNQAGGSIGAGASSGEGLGGAIATLGNGSVTLTNDTLEGNSVGGPIGATAPGAGSLGGGVYTALTTSLLNDTLDANAAIGKGGVGGNIYAGLGATLKNSIVAGGSAVSGPNCGGAVTSLGHNIENATPSQCGLSGALSDLIGVNPLIGPLQLNGGPTQTQALLPGSPAIDAGDNSGCPATDERGVLRPFGPACDIGAYERAAPAASTGSATSIGTTGATLTGMVTANAADATVSFQIGTSTLYGLQSTAQHVGGVAATPLTAILAGLGPNTTYHYRILASSIDGTTVGSDRTFTTGAPNAPITPIAHLTALGESYLTFAVGGLSTPLSGQTAARRHHKGTVFSFHLDQPATVKVAIQAGVGGRRVGRGCRPASHKLRHNARCTRTVTIATLLRTANAGVNKIAFSGRIRGKALPHGRYKAVFIAVDAAGATAPQSLSFTIVTR